MGPGFIFRPPYNDLSTGLLIKKTTGATPPFEIQAKSFAIVGHGSQQIRRHLLKGENNATCYFALLL